MIRLIGTGIWICLVTILSSYAATLWKTETPPDAEVDRLFGGMESLKTNLISVPVIAHGGIQGYILAQFTFTMKSDLVRRMSVKPDVFLLDAAFRAIYRTDAAILRGAEKQDLQALMGSIKSDVNNRFGDELVSDVLIEKYNFLPKNEVRDGARLTKTMPNFPP